MQWPIKKTCQEILIALQDYSRIEWKRTLSDLDKASFVVYQDVLNEFDSTREVRGLIVTWSNLDVTWKARPHMGIIS